MFIKKNFLILLMISTIYLVNCESNADILNKDVQRLIDLTTHLAKLTTTITVENQGKQGLGSYTYVIEPSISNNLAYVHAQLHSENEASDDVPFKVTQVQGAQGKGLFFKIDFPKPIDAGKSLTFDVETEFFNVLKPYPEEIAQSEKQFVLYKGNSHYYSLYQTKTQQTKITLASNKIESYSQVKPTSKTDKIITYGPYENAKQFEQSDIEIHYENNSPFLTVSNMLRVIELSHWGNIAVEETIDMYHSGAKLKGPFHRIDHMRRIGGASAINSFTTILPRSAADVYYRDEIGNISTSNLRYGSDSAQIEIKPRFPLFGGWKTHYTIGYNLPTYQNLFTKGNNYLLKMKLVDHVYDDQHIEHLTVKIILPEHVKNIEFDAPYDVQRGENDLHFTYLDVVGRPVIVIHKDNVVDYHSQDFQVRYTFEKMYILQEPLLVIAAFYFLFTLVIVLVRIDFSITHDPAKDTKLKLQSFWEQVNKLQEKRESLYASLEETIESYKSTKGSKSVVDKRKKIENDLKQVNTEFEALIGNVKNLSNESAEKISHLNQHDKQLNENYQKLYELATRLVGESIKKEDYIESRKNIQSKIKELTNKISSTLYQ